VKNSRICEAHLRVLRVPTTILVTTQVPAKRFEPIWKELDRFCSISNSRDGFAPQFGIDLKSRHKYQNQLTATPFLLFFHGVGDEKLCLGINIVLLANFLQSPFSFRNSL